MADIVAVANPYKMQLFDGDARFGQRQDIGERLAGVVKVAQRIDDWNGTRRGESSKQCVRTTADGNDVDPA